MRTAAKPSGMVILSRRSGQDLCPGHHRNSVYLAGSILGDFRHEQDMQEILLLEDFLRVRQYWWFTGWGEAKAKITY